ncbi:MAG: hypothetical protein ACQET1_10465, partial [Gemmatimonadota bacterium]
MDRPFFHGGGGGVRPLPLLLSLLLTGFWTGTASPALAQTVQGQLTDRASLAPVEGALAILMNAGGKEVDGA